MSARSKARKRALDVVFAADARNVDPLTLLDEREETGELTPMGEYAEQIVRGVALHHQRIDGLLAEHSQGWELTRMPAVDLAVLRIAAWELLYLRRAGSGRRRRGGGAGEVAVHRQLAALRQRRARSADGHRRQAPRRPELSRAQSGAARVASMQIHAATASGVRGPGQGAGWAG